MLPKMLRVTRVRVGVVVHVLFTINHDDDNLNGYVLLHTTLAWGSWVILFHLRVQSMLLMSGCRFHSRHFAI
jgi:hypothetical protein